MPKLPPKPHVKPGTKKAPTPPSKPSYAKGVAKAPPKRPSARVGSVIPKTSPSKNTKPGTGRPATTAHVDTKPGVHLKPKPRQSPAVPVKKPGVVSTGKVRVTAVVNGPDTSTELTVANSKVVAGFPVTGPQDEDHARRGPSSLKNKELCLGFVGKDKDSKYSIEGTRMHRHMECWAMQLLGMELPLLVIPEDSHELDLTKFEPEQIEQFDKLKGFLEPVLLKAKADGCEIFFEYKLDLRPLKFPGCDFGTADILIINRAMAHSEVYDYKFGKVAVDDAEDNVQFHAYALAAEIEFQTDTCKTVCLQPRLDVLSEADFTQADVPRLRLRVKTITERCEAAGIDYIFALGGFPIIDDASGVEFVMANLHPQMSLCEYCANVGTCPAVAEFALVASKALAIPEPDDLVPSMIADDAAKLGTLYAWCQLMEKKFESMKEEIVKIAYSGQDISGFSLRSSSGKSSTIDPLGMAELAIKEYNLDWRQILSCSDVSVSKLSTLIGKMAPKGTQGKVEEEAKKNFIDGGFVVYNGGYSYLQKDAKRS